MVLVKFKFFCFVLSPKLQFSKRFAVGTSSGNNPGLQPYKYNGKEFVEMHGYDTYDYGVRGMYPAIMRFTTPDPLAERKPWMSPYVYCSDNPVNRIDPTRKIDIDDEIQKKYPKLTEYLKNLLNEWENKNQRFKDNFSEKSGLTDAQVKEMLKFGEGPKLEVKDLTKENANGITTLVKDTKTGKLMNANNGKGLITLSNEVVNMIEKTFPNEDNGFGILMVESTTFHELTHVGNAMVNGNGNGKYPESGKAFEKDAYGKDVDPFNVKSIWRSLQPVQVIPIPPTPFLEIVPIETTTTFIY